MEKNEKKDIKKIGNDITITSVMSVLPDLSGNCDCSYGGDKC